MIKPLPCPFCGAEPDVLPEDPESEGDCWGEVVCSNDDCYVKARCGDGAFLAEDRGSEAYKQLAIARWNRRA